MARKMMVALLVVCLGVLVSFAGEKQGKMDAAAHAAKLKAELNLTSEQTTQVETIFADILERMGPIRANMRATHEELKALRNA
ncbi:MAG: periplasmic heavy metal sensor, partial [Candidatus Acidoferrales bacterium]